MKLKITALFVIFQLIGILFVFAKEDVAQSKNVMMSIFQEKDDSSKGVVLEKESNDLFYVSLRAGVHNWRDSEFVDESYGAQFELSIPLADSSFSIDTRLYYSYAKYEDIARQYRGFGMYRDAFIESSGIECLSNREQDCYGGSIQLVFNMNRESMINPYISFGAVYEKMEYEYDYDYYERNTMRYYWWASSWRNSGGWHEEGEDHGVSWIGRLGVEINSSPFYIRPEVAAVGKIYDSDDIQAELSLIFGINLSESIRLDFAGDYFTDWEEYYLTAGMTALF